MLSGEKFCCLTLWCFTLEPVCAIEQGDERELHQQGILSRLCSAGMLPWSLLLTVRAMDEIAGALVCGRKDTLDVLQGPVWAYQ